MSIAPEENICSNCGENIGPLRFEWVDEAEEDTGEVNYCRGCGEPVEEVLDLDGGDGGGQ